MHFPAFIRSHPLVLLILLFAAASLSASPQQKNLEKEFYSVDPDYESMKPRVIAVVPMVNMTFDEKAGEILQDRVYERLLAKGYQKIDASRVAQVMKKLGIQTPEMLSGISYERLGKELNCDAVIQGQVNQADAIHQTVVDSVVVSVSLQLVHCASGRVLWQCEQFRAAHRQIQVDPFNALINAISHEKASKADRIAWLAQEMLRTLPRGPIQVEVGDLLGQAVEVPVSTGPAVAEAAEESPSWTIVFEAGVDKISEATETALKEMLPFLEAATGGELSIVGRAGHKEMEGDKLSRNRASACREWIMAHAKNSKVRIHVETAAASAGGEVRPGCVDIAFQAAKQEPGETTVKD